MDRKEKDGKLRLIIDARLANVYFRRPPRGNNFGVAVLGEARVPKGCTLYGSQFDVKDFFYRFVIPLELFF